MYLAHNKGKSVVVERFIRNLKNKICKYMTLISKNKYIDKLDDTVNERNNTYHGTVEIKPIDGKLGTHFDFGVEGNNKEPKFKVGNHLRIIKYRNIFAKGYTPLWSEKVFVNRK